MSDLLSRIRALRARPVIITPTDASKRVFFRAAAVGVLAAPFIITRAAEAANVQKQIAGGVSAYTSMGFTASDFNSRANGAVVVATSTVTNASNLDLEAQVSGTVEVGGTTTVGSVLQVLVLDQNRDGSTYGGGIATGDTNPPAHLVRTSMNVKNGVTSGNAVTFESNWFPLPIGVFKFAILNNLGSALDSTANATFEYRTRNYNLNG